MPRPIYLDHHATTPTLPAVIDAMQQVSATAFGNPSSTHWAGRRARQALEDARELLAVHLGAHADEVVFTSGATESNNLAIHGLAGDPPGRLFASDLEHPCVLEPLRQLATRGFQLESMPIDSLGRLRSDGIHPTGARLLAAMLVNHETGALQPVRAIVERSAGVPVHCDAVQGVGKLRVHFHELGVTTLSLSGHKFGGPRGIGALLIRRETRLRPLLTGGFQQQGRRPGTEAVALAVGLATALQLVQDQSAHVESLRAHLLARLQAECPPVFVHGPPSPMERVAHVLNVSFPGCAGELLMLKLDLAGIACSTGSACSSGSQLASPVLIAMGLPPEQLDSAIRFSFAPSLTHDEIDDAAGRIVATVHRLRSPLKPSTPLSLAPSE